MFDNFKKLYELKKMQDSFKKERVTAGKNGVSVTMNGNFEVEEVGLNPALGISEQEQAVKDALNDARDQIQKTLAQKMMGSGLNL